MPTIVIKNVPTEVDVESELREFEWTRPTWTGDKLLAASPFRYDKSPSFFVRLEPYGEYPAGVWSDSGYYDAEWASGNFVKLLAFMRQETYEEAEDYLAEKYGVAETGDGLRLKPLHLKTQRTRQPLKETVLQGEAQPSDYLIRRGISAETQAYYGVRDCKSAVEIPWRRANGLLANVKYRSKYGKTFWYVKGADPIKNSLWGVDIVYSRRAKRAVLAEAEIDAMSWREAGFEAIACGGAEWSQAKRDLILRSPIEELIIATDNDKAGEKLRRAVESSLIGKVAIRHARITEGGCKDANEALVSGGPKAGVAVLQQAVEQSEQVRSLTYFRSR
ncbi:toprim domain-containing protein [Bacillus sp. MCCB 382]|uniref:toprim domain-containing protein n=1 Tax=Bacillus sp. MCCB 382 TaxID=2860197 RepID=UPI001C590086|nr:toprim domain-containing protein [Bacillus sp. MCCB 382]